MEFDWSIVILFLQQNDNANVTSNKKTGQGVIDNGTNEE